MSGRAKIPTRLGLFETVDRLGAGSMGEIYLCQDPSLNRKLVVKRMQIALRGYAEMADRFAREVQILAGLDHPNIVQVHGFWQDKGLLLLSMEYVNGWTLRQILDKAGKLPSWVAAAILRDLTAALQHAHSNGVIHRDLKPSNIMLGFNGRTKLLDFGIARLQDQDITNPGTLIGTTAYMSPEQTAGEVATPRSDFFSLGIIAWELLCGTHPFRAAEPELTTRNIREAKPDRQALPSSLSPEMLRFLQLTLKRKPKARPEDAVPLLQLLDTELRALPRDSAPLLAQWMRSLRKDIPPPVPPKSRQNLHLRWALGLGLMLGGAMGIWIGSTWL